MKNGKDCKKARELASRLLGNDQNKKPLFDVLLEMAEWKDKQFEKAIDTLHIQLSPFLK